jgi:hypothetical protein
MNLVVFVYLAAPQERDKTEVQTEKIWGALILPVLNIITT